MMHGAIISERYAGAKSKLAVAKSRITVIRKQSTCRQLRSQKVV